MEYSKCKTGFSYQVHFFSFMPPHLVIFPLVYSFLLWKITSVFSYFTIYIFTIHVHTQASVTEEIFSKPVNNILNDRAASCLPWFVWILAYGGSYTYRPCRILHVWICWSNPELQWLPLLQAVGVSELPARLEFSLYHIRAGLPFSGHWHKMQSLGGSQWIFIKHLKE